MKKKGFEIIAVIAIILIVAVSVMNYVFFDSKPDIDTAVYVYGYMSAADSRDNVSSEEIKPSLAKGTEEPASDISEGAGSSDSNDSSEVGIHDRTSFLTVLYETCLNRSLDDAGIDYWNSQIDSGMTASSLTSSFLFGAEFQNNHPDNESFAKALHIIFTGSTPDQSTLDTLVDELNYTKSKEEVFNDFLRAPEFQSICTQCDLTPGDPLDTPASPDEWNRYITILEMINDKRAAEGVPKLILNEKYMWLAAARAEELSRYFSHTRPDGRSCFTIYGDTGNPYIDYESELIASGKRLSAKKAAGQWLDSPEHLSILLSPDAIYFVPGYTRSDIKNKDYYCLCIISD